ncbi:hypothetical protein [Chryseobacterium luquanense]|uniref:Lipoprotein n=1 Tax=Chryseobacterium luquanense TaxID=2983766 RepID=A0ABT3XXY2_9FLAO|nr:hypothetical protein [Chryseobacterium luquanense]MCX8530758.1 hypothetical protein [Chryseobacterium luquanense]
MKKTILNASLACIMLFTITSSSKTPEKPLKEIPPSNELINSKDSGETEIRDSLITSDDSLAIKIKDYITSEYLKPEDLRVIDAAERKFNLYQIDLNNDGKKEIFINFFTPYFCGSGGCSLALLDSNLKLINKFTVTRTPITVDSKTENGWKVVWLQDGNSWKILTSKNGKYPSNPSLLKSTKEVPESNAVKLFDATTQKTYSF